MVGVDVTVVEVDVVEEPKYGSATAGFTGQLVALILTSSIAISPLAPLPIIASNLNCQPIGKSIVTI